ncbi:hypothetical protein J5834_04090 [bacterium]|nr:hypothetical protein [bacterium]
MDDIVLQYVNSGKKLRIRFDKLLVALNSGGFEGTILVIDGADRYEMTAAKGRIYTDRPLNKLPKLDGKALFALSNRLSADYSAQKEYETLFLLFKVIENSDRFLILSLMKPYAEEFFSIKPEAGLIEFLRESLTPFVNTKKIEIFTSLKKYFRVVYFLLITRYAVIIPSSDAEREVIRKKMENTTIFSEKTDEVVESGEEKPKIEDRVVSEEEKIRDLIIKIEKSPDIFSLFDIKNYTVDDRALRRSYISMVQQLHSDRLQNVSEEIALRAKEALRLVSENYELVRNEKDREVIAFLIKKYGPIKSNADYQKLKELNDAMYKATALVKLGSFDAAAKIFDYIHKQTGNWEALEKKVTTIWHTASHWTALQKAERFSEMKEELMAVKNNKGLSLEALYILAEILEYQKYPRDALDVLDEILRITPDDFRALGMKKRIVYYENLEKEHKTSK